MTFTLFLMALLYLTSKSIFKVKWPSSYFLWPCIIWVHWMQCTSKYHMYDHDLREVQIHNPTIVKCFRRSVITFITKCKISVKTEFLSHVFILYLWCNGRILLKFKEKMSKTISPGCVCVCVCYLCKWYLRCFSADLWIVRQ